VVPIEDSKNDAIDRLKARLREAGVGEPGWFNRV
jgi:hypothetical protein